MKFWSSALAILAFLPTPFAVLQQANKMPSSTGSIPETAGPEMQKLVGAFSGTWSITEKYEPSVRLPKSDSARGEEVWRALPGGMPLIEEYHAKSSDGDGYDSAVIWWNDKAHKYEGIWCATFNDPGCTRFDVTWEGDQVLMDGEFEQHGEMLAWHEVFTLAATTFRQTLDIGKPGSALKRVSTVTATKIR